MRTLLLCIVFTLFTSLPARAADVLILQSARGSAYSDALRGFHAASGATCKTTVLSDYAEVDVDRMVKEERPRLVLAVGDKALSAAKRVHDVPVITMLSLALNLQKKYPENFGGVSMMAAPERYLKLIASLGAKNVGMCYDPAKTGQYVRRIGSAAKQLGINLVTVQVTNPHELQDKLAKLKGNVDALWVLPDSTVVTTVNMEALLLFSINGNLPVITFSSQYLNNGAAAALDIDYFDLGQQTGELASSVLAGDTTRKIPTLDPRKAQLKTNESVLRKLGRAGTVGLKGE